MLCELLVMNKSQLVHKRYAGRVFWLHSIVGMREQVRKQVVRVDICVGNDGELTELLRRPVLEPVLAFRLYCEARTRVRRIFGGQAGSCS